MRNLMGIASCRILANKGKSFELSSYLVDYIHVIDVVSSVIHIADG